MELRHTLFPLHPETPPEGLTLEQLFQGRVDLEAAKSRMAGLMEAEGLPYGNRTHTYNSRSAQEMAKWAETRHEAEAIHDALYRAYFVEGVNLANLDRLAEVAAGVGLPPDEARSAIENGDFADAVNRDWRRARALGVTGVPTFVVGRRGVVGAHPYDVLERLVLEGGGVRPSRPSDGGARGT